MKKILDLVRPIARQICSERYGKDYDSLNPEIPAENKIIFECCFHANRERYRRMGIDTKKWGSGTIEWKARS